MLNDAQHLISASAFSRKSDKFPAAKEAFGVVILHFDCFTAIAKSTESRLNTRLAPMSLHYITNSEDSKQHKLSHKGTYLLLFRNVLLKCHKQYTLPLFCWATDNVGGRFPSTTSLPRNRLWLQQTHGRLSWARFATASVLTDSLTDRRTRKWDMQIS